MGTQAGNKKMKKKGQTITDVNPQPPEWDPSTKEPWFLEFEKEPVNDDKWTCIVTAAIENEAQDEKCIQAYTQCVNTGLRKAVKVLSMSDIGKFLKGSSGGGGSSTKKDTKSDRTGGQTSVPKFPGSGFKVLELAGKYASFTGSDIKLPPDLMAAVIKLVILAMKEENCLQKRIAAVRERKLREQRITEKFIRDLKPYEPREEVKFQKISSTLLVVEEPIDDEPFGGPDLYILLTSFYNVLYFPELQAINVPFVAILKISTRSETENIPKMGTKRPSAVSEFWRKLDEECRLSRSKKFKDILLLEHETGWKTDDQKQNYTTIFHELSWTQYSVYSITRQHQKYLQELHVQREFVSLESLDLAKCEVYSKLCDALITGEPSSPLLVLYAMVEQVVAGVPNTDHMTVEYQRKPTSFSVSEPSEMLEKPEILVTPCGACRDKTLETFCDKLKHETDTLVDKSEEWAVELSATNYPSIHGEETSKSTPTWSNTGSSTYNTFSSLISKVLSEQKTERENREDKRWKSPSLCFHGDSVFFQTYYCDPRIFDSETIVDRFLKNSKIPQLWRSWPELSPQERAFYNFHMNSLRKVSKEKEESLKIKILFSILMHSLANLQAAMGETDQVSEVCEADAEKRNLEELVLDERLLSLLESKEKNFRNYFLKTFVLRTYLKKMGIQQDSLNSLLQTGVETSPSSRSIAPKMLSWPMTGICGRSENCPEETTEEDRILTNFYSVLSCKEISYLGEVDAPNFRDFQGLIESFKFYEKLEPYFMIQRLVEAQENFNDLQYLYYPPTDTVIVVLLNNYDSRGIFCNSELGVLPTPVGLKDFYRYVYPEIPNWLIEEEAEHAEFVSELLKKQRAKEEKLDAAFLEKLKRKFCSMTEDKREEFLSEKTDDGGAFMTVKEKDLKELPNKPKPSLQDRISFVSTNFTDVRVETKGKINEFHSQDGTQVTAIIDGWLNDPSQLLRVRIKRSNFSLHHHQYLGKPPETKFILRTDSNIIFSFDKGDDLKYHVTISWPTGLLVRPVWHPESGLYIKQNYIKPYRRGWDIEEEKSRCFLRSGHVIIFKSNGDYDVLFGSGTRYSHCSSEAKIFSTTGEVWKLREKSSCPKKKTCSAINKVFLGVHPQTRETFYKREDGTYCMLWPSGRLVTNFPDGTKITSTPYVEDEEMNSDWTLEEILYFKELEDKHRLKQDVRKRRSILRHSTTSGISSVTYVPFTGFVMISCEYLIEHPKYSTVYFSPNDPNVKVTMPEQLTVLMDKDGNYEVQQGRNFLSVCDKKVEFYMRCPECQDKSTVKLYLDSREVLYKCVDFFQQGFLIFSDGKMNYLKVSHDSDSAGESEGEDEDSEKFSIPPKQCLPSHRKSQHLRQRCFALERDLSGIEFLHTGCLAVHFYQVPDDTYFDLNTGDSKNICHTFNSPVYKIGCEKWSMEYEENNSLPTNLKKKDLKELGVKQVARNIFKYPFPKNHNCSNQQTGEKTDRDVKEPKAIISRTFWCLADDPKLVIDDLRMWVAAYQARADQIYNEYKNHKALDNRSCDSRYVEMRLKKIALTLSQSPQMYPHLCTNLPSTEKDIHYFGHFINEMEKMESYIRKEPSLLPDCKQIPHRLPRLSEFSSIYEESESPRST